MINLRKLKESIVLITSAKKANVIGTGFAFYKQEDDTYLLTCAHVVEDVGGEENVRVNDIPVELVEIGDAQGFDLAILKVKYIFPSLTLMILYGEQERSFEIKIPGNFLMGENKARRRQIITGIMMVDGETALQTIDNQEEEVAVGKLKINKGELKKGYSGAPVVDLETGFVLGVTTHKVDKEGAKEGSFGTAISIEALEKIWCEMPTEVSQQIIREPSESSDDLPVEETQIEPFFTEDLGNGVILEMVSIPGGTFMMGSPENENSLTLAFIFNPPKQSLELEDCFGGILASRENYGQIFPLATAKLR